MKTLLTVDLGAGSGRVIAARYDGSKVKLEVVSRFDNTPVSFGGHLYWNLTQLLQDIRSGLQKAVSEYGEIASVGIDTWGVDYGLLDKNGRLLGLPYAYRDIRNNPENTQKAIDKIGRRSCYNTTGIQFIDFNTIFQLHAETQEPTNLLEHAERLLFIPDLLNYALCGVMANESTIASTSGLIDLKTRDWSGDLLDKLSIPSKLFSTPVAPGTVLGNIRGIEGLENTPVITVGAHDTASAVASAPALPNTNWGYLATGTWALFGVEIPTPVLSDASYELSYTHEGAVNGDFRYLKNCTGMWLIQELRRAWSVNGVAPGYEDMMNEAEKAEPFKFFIDPDYPSFQKPGKMPEKMAEFCRLTGQKEPQTRGEFYRTAMEGIVLRYRQVWRELEMLTGTKRDFLHMLGGAIRDRMHGHFTADALATKIICGPVEGAAMGNALAQLVGLGEIKDFTQGRAIVRASTELSEIEPENTAPWQQAAAQWEKIKAAAK